MPRRGGAAHTAHCGAGIPSLVETDRPRIGDRRADHDLAAATAVLAGKCDHGARDTAAALIGRNPDEIDEKSVARHPQQLQKADRPPAATATTIQSPRLPAKKLLAQPRLSASATGLGIAGSR